MTAHLYEAHCYRHPGAFRWKIQAFAPGFPKPTVPIKTDYRWTKRGARQLVTEWQADGTIGAVEIFWHDKKGRIIDRSTLPRSADPRGRG